MAKYKHGPEGGKGDKLVPKTPRGDKREGLSACIESMIAELPKPEQAIEVFYLTRDPEMLRLVRRIAALSGPERAATGNFIDLMRGEKPDGISPDVVATADRRHGNRWDRQDALSAK